MKIKTIVLRLRNNHTKEVKIIRYASGDYVIKEIYSYKDKNDMSFICPEIFRAMMQLETGCVKSKQGVENVK